MIREGKRPVGSGKDAETISVEALSFMASNPEVCFSASST